MKDAEFFTMFVLAFVGSMVGLALIMMGVLK